MTRVTSNHHAANEPQLARLKYADWRKNDSYCRYQRRKDRIRIELERNINTKFLSAIMKLSIAKDYFPTMHSANLTSRKLVA